jgi:hypothetical protein
MTSRVGELGFSYDKKSLEGFCRKWRIQEFALFGSSLRADFRPDSDVDVLVEFEAGAPWDLFDFVEAREELANLFGRPVDLVEKEGVKNPFRRKAILGGMKVLYVQRPE